MGAIKDGILVLVVLLVTLEIGNCDGIITDQCSITRSCLQCLSSETSELERCIQLNLLITETTNHPVERDLYCTGHCPMILATAYYYCGLSSGILFNECAAYTVQPTGEGEFERNTCSLSMSSVRGCELCTHQQSRNALVCLQHQLLAQNTNNTEYRASYCAGDCPLTLATSNWYCGGDAEEPFEECRQNGNGRYCEEIMEQVQQDIDVVNCFPSSSNCRGNSCTAAINKYGCCLLSIDSRYGPNCGVMDCATVETGKGHTHLATPLLVMAMVLSAAIG